MTALLYKDNPMTKEQISKDFPYSSQFVDVLGSKMHYIEQGSGHPILFLHDIPTCCYLWRNVIPHLSRLGRCIAPDLIGMGKSDKPAIEYSIEDHIRYIDHFIEAMNLKKVTLVLHGWGSIIGFDYAMRNEKNCRGLIFYESFLRPMNGDNISLPYQQQLMALEEQENIKNISLNGVDFVDFVLPQTMMRSLTSEELRFYREPFVREGSSKPLAQYFNELPRGDGKSKVDNIIAEYSKKLVKSYLPKLMLYSLPGFITTVASIMWAKEHLSNLEIAEIGEDLHYAQESNPVLMGETISIWMQGIEQTV